MFLSVMTLNFALFFFGYVMLLLDRKRFETYNVKMKYTCHDIMNVLYKGKYYTVVQWYKDFLKEPQKAEEESEKFLKENSLPANYSAENKNEHNSDEAMEYYTKALTFIEANLNEDKRQNFRYLRLKQNAVQGVRASGCCTNSRSVLHIFQVFRQLKSYPKDA